MPAGSGYGGGGYGTRPITSLPPVSSGRGYNSAPVNPSTSTNSATNTPATAPVAAAPTTTTVIGRTANDVITAASLDEFDSSTASEIRKHSKLKNISAVYEVQIAPTIGDKITNFNPQDSLLVFDEDELISNGMKRPKLKIVKSEAQVEKLEVTKATLIYNVSTGELFFNENGSSKGLGEMGGLVAVIENKPRLTSSNISFYSHSI